MSASNHFCNVCAVWVNGNIGNVKRHEQSDFHKANVQLKVKKANEKSKSDKAEAVRVNKELDAINRAAAASMSINGRDLSQPAMSASIQTGWITVRDPHSGKEYLFDKVSGETRWIHADEPIEKSEKPPHKQVRDRPLITQDIPPETGRQAVSSSVTTAPPPRPTTSAPPPRPVNSAPPPRPVTASNTAPPPRPQTGTRGPPPRPSTLPESVKILKSVMMSSEEAARNDPGNTTNRGSSTSTGFGEWEEVAARESNEPLSAEPAQIDHETTLFQKQEKLCFSFKSVKRETPDDEDADEPLFATRQIKKSSRTRHRTDD